MSIYRPNAQAQQVLQRQKTAISARLHENMRLKVVSLIAAVALYVFVQNEHNPTITREFSAEVVYQHVPPNAEVDTTQRRVTFFISGSRLLLDSIKDSDLRAVANMTNRPVSVSKMQTIPQLALQIPKLTSEQINQLNIDTSGAVFRFRLIGFVKTDKALNVPLKTPPPPGFHYGKPAVQPSEVVLSGREDRVDMVERVMLDFKTGDDGKIKGVFPVTLHDHDDAPVEGVTVTPPMVSVSVPLVPDALTRVVTTSADIKDTPAPPLNFTYHVEPGRVKITGNAEAVNRTFTLMTDEISLRNETQNRDITANLVIPDGVTVQDMQGNGVKKVKVHIVILRSMTTPPTKPVKQDTTPPIPPVDPNG